MHLLIFYDRLAPNGLLDNANDSIDVHGAVIAKVDSLVTVEVQRTHGSPCHVAHVGEVPLLGPVSIHRDGFTLNYASYKAKDAHVRATGRAHIQ